MMIVKGRHISGYEMQAIVPDIPMVGALLPWAGRVSYVALTKQMCADIVKWFGHEDFCPMLPILLCIPGGWGQLAGMGLAPASELRDEAIARWELQEARIARTGGTFDFDTAREKIGAIRRENLGEAVREAFFERAKHMKRNPRLDPNPQRRYPNPTGKQVFPVDGLGKDEHAYAAKTD